MKRFWAALAVALISMLAVAGCNDYGNTFQANTGAQVAFLSPSNISAGSPDFILTINGTGFVPQTYVTWNGKKLNTVVALDNTKTVVLGVTATVPAALVAKPGTATVITQNPFSGAGNNGLSNPVTFIINPPPNPVPTLTSIAPATYRGVRKFVHEFHFGSTGNKFYYVIDRSHAGIAGSLDCGSDADKFSDDRCNGHGYQGDRAWLAYFRGGNGDGDGIQSACTANNSAGRHA